MKLYRIKDWNARYENNRSRTVKDLAWVSIPNRHDGEGYSILMAHPKAAEIYAAWILMLQVASRCQPRGSLVRDNGKPLTPEALALKTRTKASWFSLALEVLQHEDVDWIEAVEVPDSSDDASECQEPDSLLPGFCPQGDEEQNRTEGNGKDGMGGEESPSAPAPAPVKFIKPALEAIKLHAAKIGLPETEAERFYHYYEANGWRVGRNPMKSWPSAMVNWRKGWEERKHTNARNPPNSRPVVDRNAGTANEGRANDYANYGKV